MAIYLFPSNPYISSVLSYLIALAWTSYVMKDTNLKASALQVFPGKKIRIFLSH